MKLLFATTSVPQTDTSVFSRIEQFGQVPYSDRILRIGQVTLFFTTSNALDISPEDSKTEWKYGPLRYPLRVPYAQIFIKYLEKHKHDIKHLPTICNAFLRHFPM
jgi:hypothetical protein